MSGRNDDRKRGKTRELMTFREITDAFVEGGVKSSGAAWSLAKQRKLVGHDTLYNTLGPQDVRALLAKVLSASYCRGSMSDTLKGSRNVRRQLGDPHVL